MHSKTLIVAGALSLLAAVAHVAVIVGGPDWYRLFGTLGAWPRLKKSASR